MQHAARLLAALVLDQLPQLKELNLDLLQCLDLISDVLGVLIGHYPDVYTLVLEAIRPRLGADFRKRLGRLGIKTLASLR